MPRQVTTRVTEWIAGLAAGVWLCAVPALAIAQAAPPELPGVDDIPTDPQTWWDRVPEWLQNVWEMQLFSAGDSAVHLSQLVIALLILLVGVWVARFITRVLQARLMKRSRMNRNSAALVQKLSFYLLLVVIALFAMQVMSIPITVFTVLGGAAAVAVGFGAQNIINNFISGLILMIERPVRLGDLIEIGEHIGRVKEIGARCTHVQRLDGIDVLVPNSSLLENNVTNWTLSDDTFRTSVTVGVAYGSPTEQVAEIIGRAVRETDRVLDDRPTIVLFTEFGDNALTFEAYFWTHIEQVMDLRIVRSNVRFKIDAMFREAGITIAFPQRDVHLDGIGPIEVRLADQRGGQTGSEQQS